MKLKGIRVQPAGGDGIASGEEFYFGFVHAAAFVAFVGKHVPFARQFCQFRRGIVAVGVEAAGEQHVDGDCGFVVAKGCGDGFKEGAFATAAGAVGDDELFLFRAAGEAVADEFLHPAADGRVGKDGADGLQP